MLDHKEGIADIRSPAMASIEEAGSSDIFILLLGETYKEPLDDNKSYTHQEYDMAIKKKLNILAFPIGDCYNPSEQNLSTNYQFRKFQKDVLENKYHITAPYTPSIYSVDKMYKTIYQSLKNHIHLLIEKGIKVPNQSIPSQLTSRLGKSTIVGREKELKEIDQYLNSSNTLLLINGIDGVGKSNIASYYLHSHKEQFDYYGFFEGIESFTTELQEPLNLKAEKPQEILLEALSKLRKLEGNKLLIFDDIKNIEENQESIHKILGLKNCGYKLLFTSREDIEEIENYYLDILSLDDAKALFNSIYKVEDEQLLEKILGYLDCHAFFVEKTAHSIKINLTLQMIKERFENEEFSKINVKRKEGFNQLLNKLFTLDRLDKEEILTLKQLSGLPSIEVPFEKLEEILQKKDEVEFEELLNYLSKKGWIIKLKNGYKLHQIIKEYILLHHTPNFHEIKIIINSLNKSMNNIYDIRTALNNKTNIIYFKSLISFLKKMKIKNEEVNELFNNLAIIYYHFGIYKKAKKLFLRTLKIRKKIYKKNHINISNSYNNLGVLYTTIGKYKKAMPLLLIALDIRKDKLKKEHIDTAKSYSNLAEIYYLKGYYEKAESFLKKALKINKKIFGKNHFDTTKIYNGLAILYRRIGKYKKAKKLYLKAIKIRESSLGKNHPYTAESYNNLALLYRNIGLYIKAKSLHIKALKIRRKSLGKNHPSTAVSFNNLALMYESEGKNNKAKKIYKKALKLKKKSLGKKHQCTANTYDGLGFVYMKKKKYKKAKSLYIKALKIRKKSLGKNHPSTAISYSNIAMIYKLKGKYKKSEYFYIKSLNIKKDIFSSNHLNLANTYSGLSDLYVLKNSYQKAYFYTQKSLKIRLKTLPEKHPKLVKAKKNLYLIEKKLDI